MSDGKIKLIYFDARGLAELSRLILAQAGVEYEDHRFAREDWPEIKKTMPAGQVPALEYKGEIVSQSKAIARFLAREFHLYGKNNWEAAKADMVVDCVVDLISKVVPIIYSTDEEKKKELLEAYLKETLPNFTTNMEKLLEKNGGKHFAGSDLTIADLAVADALQNLENRFGSEWREKTPKLAKHVDDVFALPNIKKWVENRPKTEN